MKIFGAEQIRQWDAFTIAHEPISSSNLMERAANACAAWIYQHYFIQLNPHFVVVCGKGNNGGDGLAIARMLLKKNCSVSVYILESGHKGTDDFQTNLVRLHNLTTDIHFIQDETNFPHLQEGDVVIDALFGSGLSRPLDGVVKNLVRAINHSGCPVIAIDIPSGLRTEGSSKGYTSIHAADTLSFQVYKPAFMLAENGFSIGKVSILDIGLHKQYYSETDPLFELMDEELINSIYQPRNAFAHKGNFGHAALICGSTGYMGAAVLAAKAGTRSGVGKLTAYIPKTGYEIMQVSVPEAMANVSGSGDFITNFHPISDHEAIGMGPGIGVTDENLELLKSVFNIFSKPMVIDADALTLLAKDKNSIRLLPPVSILTPHPKEFERLFGETENEWERINLARKKATELNVIIVLKGHHTLIALPDGKAYFNSTGNAGMATGGSGDVLTGLLTGLLAQGYSPADACLLGVYLHGLAGDLAAAHLSKEAMVAGDIIAFLGEAFKIIAA